MNRFPRRLLAAFLTVALTAGQLPAQNVSVPRVTLTPALGGGAAGAAGLLPGAPGAPSALSLSPMLSLTPTLSVMSAPAIAAPVTAVQAVAVAAAPASASPALSAAAIPAPAKAQAPAQRVAAALEALELSAASRHGRGRNDDRGGAMFDGSAKKPASAYIINDEGVKINDRAAVYYTEVRRMVELYKGTINLEESLDVMDDAYSDVLAKVSAVEAVAKGRGLSQVNTHLEETLTFVDGVLDDGAKKVAVHTHRVFFHKAANPESEIAEGIRRVDGYIRDAEKMFSHGGKAEQQMGKLDEVELVFDARGYQEIKDHVKKRGDELTERTRGRIRFKFLDELAPLPREQKEIRAKLNELAQKYNGDGLSKIYEGVIYSRYVGLLLELKTVEHYHKLGYKILQSGRELFDGDGMYVSELDVVVESPEGVVSVVEAKSARVGLPPEEVLQDKVVYKLRTYKKFKAQLDAMIGKNFDAVVFSMDVAIDPNIDRSQVLPRDLRKLELIDFLRSQEASLSREYGFPVSFLFLQSGPEGGNSRGFAPRGDRKHGRRR